MLYSNQNFKESCIGLDNKKKEKRVAEEELILVKDF